MPERVSLQGDVYRKIFSRRIPDQQHFAIYKGAPLLQKGKLCPRFVLLSQDHNFVFSDTCFNKLLREMEKMQGHLRFLSADAKARQAEKLARAGYSDPLKAVRTAV